MSSLSNAQELLRPPTPPLTPSVTVANVPEPRNTRLDRWWMASMFAVGGATAADAATSWSKVESNSILASKNGTFGSRGVEIKSALAAAILAPQIILRRRSDLRRTFLIGNTAAAGLFTAAAVHNTGVDK